MPKDGGDRHLAFGPFVLSARQRVLSQNGKPVRLRGREFDLLQVLVENAGEVVDAETLTAHVWPNTTVADANLRVQIAALRRALGDGRGAMRYIVTVAGRGYVFSAPVQALPEAFSSVPAVEAEQATPHRLHNLPLRLKSLIGRREVHHRLMAHMPQRRLVTVVGSGGVGKTTVALAVAEEAGRQFRDGVLLVDLSPVTDGRLIPTALANTLGLTAVSADPIEEIIQYLKARQLLLLFDNCEHLVGPAAEAIERILRGADMVTVLATSREPLRVEGEWLFRLPPLETPRPGLKLKPEAALAYSAIELFVERARATSAEFELTDSTAERVVDLCRQLDGNPLAVELAAARIDVFGIAELANRIEDVVKLLSKGPRNAAPRQQSLRATLDWSYQLLSPQEQVVLQRLSVFRGDFDYNAAQAVSAAGEIGHEAVQDALDELSGKSLLVVDTGEAAPRYRLLFVTRAYASEKLSEAGDAPAVSLRHAQHYLAELKEADRLYTEDTHAEFLERHRRIIDDVRASIDWAFSPEGDSELGLELTAAAVQPGLKLSLFKEYGQEIDRALTHASIAGGTPVRRRLRLLDDRAYILHHTTGDKAQIAAITAEIKAILETIAPTDPVDPGEALAFGALFGQAFSLGDAPTMKREAAKIVDLAQKGVGESWNLPTGERMLAQSLHFLGDHSESLRLADRVLSYPPDRLRVPSNHIDARITLRIFKARIAWLQGRALEATALAEEAEVLASTSYVHVHCYALALASCPIALWRGDISLARRHARKLSEIIAAHEELHYWGIWSGHYQHVVNLLDDDQDSNYVQRSDIDPQHADHLGTFHETLVGTLALHRVRAGLTAWSAPEILRGHAETSLRLGEADPVQARRLLSKALATAESHGALAWELRTATSIARLDVLEGRHDAAADSLALILDRFTEGFEDEDYIKAEALLSSLERR